MEIQQNDTFIQILFAGYRFFLAALLLFLFIYIKERKVYFIKGSLPAIVQVGFFQTALQYLTLHIGMSYSTGIESSIITGSTTFFSILIAHFMYTNDRINVQKIIGLTLGFIGVFLATGYGGTASFSFGLGAIALLIAALSNAIGGIMAKNKATKLDPIYLTAYQMLIGSLALLVIGGGGAGFTSLYFTQTSVALLFYLSTVSALGFVLWNILMKYNSVSKISMFFFLIPLFGVLQSALYLGETLYPIVFLSLILVILGIIVVNNQLSFLLAIFQKERKPIEKTNA